MSRPDRIGRFTITGELGRGAMGIVYLAEDPFLGRKVAIKTIQVHPGLADSEIAELRGRFENEARAAANLAHPNMVTIFDAGADERTLYIAMEYVQGEPLDEILKSDRVLTYKEVADLALQLAGALDYAHQRGIVHRDIKPANILVNRAGQPKITDFGVARQAASTLTATGTIIGTPAYMSPEQITGHKVTGASDQFSLAIVLYEVLTGRKPFFGEGATTILYKIVHEDPDPPGSVQKELPAAIDAILLRALSKSPEERFPTCLAFAEELRNVLGAAPAEPALRLTATASGSLRAEDLGISADAQTSLNTDSRGLVPPPPPAAKAGAAAQAARPAVPVATAPATATAASPLALLKKPVGIAAAVLVVGAIALAVVFSQGGQSEPTSEPAVTVENDPQADPFAAADGLGEPLLDGIEDPAASATNEVPPLLRFRITSRPAGARLMVDGRPLEQATPVEIEVTSADRHTLLLEHIGHNSVAWAFVPSNLSQEQIDSGTLFFPMEPLQLEASTTAGSSVELVDPGVSASDVPLPISAQAAAEPEDLEPLDPNGPIRVRGNARNMEQVEVEDRVEPRFPDWAEEQQLPRFVVLELVVDRRGRVRDAKVLRPVHPTLESMAIEAVRKWRFKPARRDGEAVDAYFNVSVQFRPPR